MVDREKQRSRYVASADGAPPVPPPGGYRGARRVPLTRQEVSAAAVVAPQDEPVKASGFAIGTLIASALFALVLLIFLLVGATDLIYGVGVVTVQLMVLGLAIAAVATRRGRLLGGIALSIVLVVNIATVGALSALRTSATGTYAGQKSDDQKHAEAYPGMKDVNPNSVLSQASLEEIQADGDDVLAAIRDAATQELGLTWVQTADAAERPERNGYGGESMLVYYTSAFWMTEQPVQGFEAKSDVLDVIDGALDSVGLDSLYSFNDPSVSGEDDGILERFYGSTDPRTQHTWEAYSSDWTSNLLVYVTIYDLSQDATGDFATERQGQHDRTGEPLEGVQIFVTASPLLSEADRDEFEQRLDEYDSSFGG